MSDTYRITPEAVGAMLQYCNVTPTIMQDILASIRTLMEAYDTWEPRLVQAHTSAYRDILCGLRDFLLVIAEDVNASNIRINTLARQYAGILDQRIR